VPFGTKRLYYEGKVQTMRSLDSIFQFVAGKIEVLAEAPEWIRDAVIADRQYDDWNQSLSEQGAEMIESYGVVNETADVWRNEGDGWLIEWQDTTSHVMSVYIGNVIDFAGFQVAWLCPMATKIMAADTYIRENQARARPSKKRKVSPSTSS
jgi:hypothetical protein